MLIVNHRDICRRDIQLITGAFVSGDAFGYSPIINCACVALFHFPVLPLLFQHVSLAPLQLTLRYTLGCIQAYTMTDTVTSRNTDLSF